MSEKILGGTGSGLGGSSVPTVTPDTLVSEDIIEFSLAVSEGPIAGIHNGAKGFYLDDTPLVSPGGNNNFSTFNLSLFHGSAVATKIPNQLGGTSSSSNVGVTLAQGIPVTRTTPSVLRNQINVLEIRLNFNQLMRVTSSGDQLTEIAEFKLQYRQEGSSTWLNFFSSEIIQLGGKTSGGFVKEFRRRVPRINADWEIRVLKVSPDSDAERLIDFGWESFQMVTSGERSYDDLAVVLGLARASDQFTSVPNFTMDLGGRVIKVPSNFNPVTRHYSGVWDGNFVLKHTDSLVWCIYDAVMNERYGARRHNPNLILDRFSAYEAALWCDTLVPRGDTGTFQPRYTYNDLIDQPRPGLDMIRYMLGIFGGVLVSDGPNTVRIKFEKPRAIEQIFGLESVTPEGFNYQFSDVTSRPNDITVTFINPDLNWEQDVRQIKDDALIERNGRITEDLVAVGCIDVYEGQRRAFSRLLKANTETMTVSFQTARQGLMLEMFSLIGIADPTMNWGLTGRVKSVAGSTITLRDFLFLPINTNLLMSVQTPTGVAELTVRTSTANTKTLTIFSGVYPATAPDKAQFSITSAAIGLVKPFSVMGIVPDVNNPDLFTITATEFNTNRFGDTDNLTSSGVQNYQGTINTRLPAPVITSVQSGPAHQLRNQDGSVTARMAVELSVPSGISNRVRVFYRRVDDDVDQHVSGRGTTFYIPNVVMGQDYRIFAKLLSANADRVSVSSNVVVHTVAVRGVVPSSPTGWVASSGFDSITLRGQAHPDPDFGGFKIYGATAASTNLTLLATVSANHYTRHVPAGDTITRYRVSMRNRFGAESLMTGFIAAVPTPPALSDFDPSVSVAIENTARLSMGGVSKNPIFSRWPSTTPTDVQLLPATGQHSKLSTGVRYVNALVLNANVVANARPQVRLDRADSSLDCSPSPQQIKVVLEVELVSGTISGSLPYLQALWSGDGGGTAGNQTINLNSYLTNSVGVVQRVEFFLKRPATYSGIGTQQFYLDFYAKAAGASVSVLRLHRFDFEEVLADTLASIYQQAALDINEVKSATVGLRAVAGSAGAELELVALDSPVSGPSSVARLRADNILLDGTVQLQHLNVTAGNLIPNGQFATGTFSGWRRFNSSSSQTVVARDTSGMPAGGPTAFMARHFFIAGDPGVNTFSGEKAFNLPGREACAISVIAGETYLLTIDATKAGGTFSLVVQVFWLFADGTTTSENVINVASLPNTWEAPYTGQIVAPAGAVACWPRVLTRWVSGGNGSVYWSNLTMRQMDGGSLTVDGAFSAKGLAIFGGSVGSNNFVNNSVGWQVTQAGGAQFNNLVVRNWLQVGSVSDEWQEIAAGPFFVPSGVTQRLFLDLGAVPRGNIHLRGLQFEARAPNALAGVNRLLINLQRRKAALGGAMEPYETVESFEIGTAWDVYSDTGLLSGFYDDFEYRVTAETTVWNGSAWVASAQYAAVQCLRNVWLTVQRVTR
jgi:predicted phage tail protein